jgi:hypothetical protein
MGLFFRKKKISKDLIDEDLKIIKQNCQIIDVLMVHGDACEPLCEKLKDLREKIEFLNPSTNPDVKNADKKISGFFNGFCFQKAGAKGYEQQHQPIYRCRDRQRNESIQGFSNKGKSQNP